MPAPLLTDESSFLQRTCAKCGGSYVSKLGELKNEYCQACLWENVLFTRAWKLPTQLGPTCEFCGSPLPRGRRKYCSRAHGNWYRKGHTLEDVVVSLCVICGKPFESLHGARATCSKSCAVKNRENRNLNYCKRCHRYKGGYGGELCLDCRELHPTAKNLP